MRKFGLLLAAGAAAALGFSEPAAAADSGDLLAGQTIDVGDWIITNDATNIVVEIDMSQCTADGCGWALVNTKVDAQCDSADIPQNKNGNPKNGQFMYKMNFSPFITETDGATTVATIPLSSLGGCNLNGNMVYVALHATVFNINSGFLTMTTVISGEGASSNDPTGLPPVEVATMITRERAGNDGMSFENSGVGPVPAVIAWEPCTHYPNCPNSTAIETTPPTVDIPSLWDNRIDDTLDGQDLQATGADWIWSSWMVQDPIFGTVLRMERNFDVPGLPVDTHLLITCDNAYEVFINSDSNSVGEDGVNDANWRDSDLYQDNVDTNDWDVVDSYAPNPGYFNGFGSGETLIIDAANEYMDTDDSNGSGGFNPEGTKVVNPGGCIFALTVKSAEQSETAWGNGTAFPGSNWATYISYTVVLP